MSKVYLTGGTSHARQTNLSEEAEGFAFGEALVLELDTDSRSVRTVLQYRSPAENCPDINPSILFKAGSRTGDWLDLCTTTEIMRCKIGDWRVTDVISDRRFNDVHHVTTTPAGTKLIAVTGLDMVVEMAPDGNVISEWSVAGEKTWERFSNKVDYRKIHSTKPHSAHPNYVFYLNGEAFVTRFIQRDAISLINPERRIDIGVQGVHDGMAVDGKIYFTTVDGHVVIADCDSLQVTGIIDLREMVKSVRQPGWCRGLHMLADGMLLVGFSRLRITKIKENIAWVKAGVKKAAGGILGDPYIPDMPTHLSLFDLKGRRHLWDIEIEKYGMQAVFSIL